MPSVQKISPCLWFDGPALEAAEFYVSVFPNSKICSVSRYGEAGKEHHGKEPGEVMVAAFELEGQSFTALNGGPMFKISEAVSFQINCDTQEELDHYWDRLSEGGSVQQCGWLKDKFGVSWQVLPKILPKLMSGSDPVKSQRAMMALMGMVKLDINALKHAYEGE